MTIHRVIGTETEFGVLQPGNIYANPIQLSADIVYAYAPSSSAENSDDVHGVSFDYHGEDPLQDMRGHRLERAAAHPSQLTDDPNRMAPSGVMDVSRSMEQYFGTGAPNCMLSNGARFYVDHAHPEYSSPEVSHPLQAVLYDRAGDLIARRAMDKVNGQGKNIVLYKNNVDGKGASYGAHENYLMKRDVDFKRLANTLIPFMVTRPVLCGAGRVGIGQKSEHAGFQISQRADYVENDIGLETTFNRPIINTRDEPHASRSLWRRLHVIGGDANLFDYSIYLKVGSMAAVLWLCENTDFMDKAAVWALAGDPVDDTWNVSHDITLTHTLRTVDGRDVTALDYQQFYCESFANAVGDADKETATFIDTWQGIIDGLRHDMYSVADKVEWVGKLQLLDSMRQRLNVGWDDARIRSMDVLWHDLRPEKSLVVQLEKAGRVARMVTDAQVEQAAQNPPSTTRAYIRGRLVERFPGVIKAGWESVLLDTGEAHLKRLSLGDPLAISDDIIAALNGDSLNEVITAMSGGSYATTGQRTGRE